MGRWTSKPICRKHPQDDISPSGTLKANLQQLSVEPTRESSKWIPSAVPVQVISTSPSVYRSLERAFMSNTMLVNTQVKSSGKESSLLNYDLAEVMHSSD